LAESTQMLSAHQPQQVPSKVYSIMFFQATSKRLCFLHLFASQLFPLKGAIRSYNSPDLQVHPLAAWTYFQNGNIKQLAYPYS